MKERFDPDQYTSDQEQPSFQDQLEFLQRLSKTLHKGESVVLSKQDAPMIQGISENAIALKLLLSSRGITMA